MLLELVSPKFLLLYVLLASALYVHFRGKVRHGFGRQLTDHSTFMAPYNALIYLFSAVPNKPVLDTADFPELALLRENWETIRDEARALSDEGHIKAAAKKNDLAFNSFFKRGWKRFYLKWYNDGYPSAEALCPKTVELIRSIPSIHAAMFTSMEPRSVLGEHRDPFGGSLRYHLGLMTPNSDDCRIYIDGEPYAWRDGEDILFDETYIHHVNNDTDQSRVILFCDVERPIRNPVVRALNRFVIHHVVKASATQNVQGEKVGALNKVFGAVHAVQSFFRRIKQWNRKVYYTGKYAVFAALAYLLFIGPIIHRLTTPATTPATATAPADPNAPTPAAPVDARHATITGTNPPATPTEPDSTSTPTPASATPSTPAATDPPPPADSPDASVPPPPA